MKLRSTNRPDTAPLRLIGLDSRFSDEQLEVLARDTDVLRVAAGEVLARVGEVARQFIAVVDGYVEITDQAGNSSVAGSWTQIGATELATGQQHTATVTTRSETTLVVIFGPAFKTAMKLSALAPSMAGPSGVGRPPDVRRLGRVVDVVVSYSRSAMRAAVRAAPSGSTGR